ncbi:hypothetical protein F5I97DRAFT_1811654 [Phlebopus sp. FC_14]|nr:hypothetical protein F5I97DRAFT_1811654 [Phlebopus sp. FC_14]
MSDVRALLKAKRQEARISHPLASYTSSGQLRCIVCQTNIKHASAWEGHLGSKGHRTNAARLREEERLREQREQQEQEAKAMLLKRRAEETVHVEAVSKKRKTSPSNFPADFFSDPSQSLPFPPSDDSEEEPEDVKGPQERSVDSTIDQEWIHFQQTVVNAPDERETYDRATIFAEPQLVSKLPEGFPSTEEDVVQVEPEPDLDEEGARRRKEQEERELIMDRLMDEERAQEEADMKVTMMKNKLEALRRKREASRSTKVKSAVS